MKPLGAFLLALTFSACCKRDALLGEPEPVASVAEAPSAEPTRCALLGKEYVVGKQSAGSDTDDILPFATEIGEAVEFEAGFAAGALRQDGGGTSSVIVTATVDGSVWKEIRLGASHGDAEAPRVFARGKVLGAAVLEPSGMGRSLRILQLRDNTVHWGAEFVQGQDESLAFDVAVGENVAMAVWDAIPKDREVSGIYAATFDPQTFEKPSLPQVLTLLGTDADSPRLVVRPGGFWLMWIARRPAQAEYDAQYRAEDIAYRWLEVVPLDNSGQLVGTPRRIGSDSGHVLAYDVGALPDGSASVFWRDDDTPTGSVGGQLMKATVRLGGIDGPDRIMDEHTGAGAPSVLSGWFAIADATSSTRLVPLDQDGKLLDRLTSEPLLGPGEPLANRGDLLLVSRPSGQAVRLFVAKCGRQVALTAEGGAEGVEGSEEE